MSLVSLGSCVNLIVLWIWLIVAMHMVGTALYEDINEAFPYSMFGSPSSFNFSSSSPINAFAYYAGAIFVPIAVPWICR